MRRWMISLLLMLILTGCNFGGQVPTTAPTDVPPPTSAALAPTLIPTALPTTQATDKATRAPAIASTVARTAAATEPLIDPPLTSAPTVDSTMPATLPPVTAQPQAVVNAPPTSVPTVSAPAINVPTASANPRVLAWNRDTKQVAWYALSGQPQVIAEGAATRVSNCGVTPAGDKLILYRGDTVGQPNLIGLNGSEAPVPLGNGSALACELSGRTAFSPDGGRLAFIKYAPDATVNADFTVGLLRILTMPDAAEQASIDKVTAFDLQNDGAVIFKFFANAKGLADRADLVWWDGAKENPLEMNIKSLEGCFFTSGRVLRAGDKVYTAIGERCAKPGGGSTFSYRVLRTDWNNGKGGNTTPLVDKSAVGGKYFSNTNTNDLILLPDGKTLLVAFPNGLSTDVANLALISLADGKVNGVAVSVITDQAPAALPRRFLRNPQGTQLAFVSRNSNGGETLYLYDLTKPDVEPAPLTDTNRSNKVNALAWNQAGDRLAYLISGDDPSLSYFDLRGDKKLVARGIFQGLVLSPDGSIAGTSEQIKKDNNDLRNNLIEITLSDGTRKTLVEGGKGDSALVPLILR